MTLSGLPSAERYLELVTAFAMIVFFTMRFSFACRLASGTSLRQRSARMTLAMSMASNMYGDGYAVVGYTDFAVF